MNFKTTLLNFDRIRPCLSMMSDNDARFAFRDQLILPASCSINPEKWGELLEAFRDQWRSTADENDKNCAGINEEGRRRPLLLLPTADEGSLLTR